MFYKGKKHDMEVNLVLINYIIIISRSLIPAILGSAENVLLNTWAITRKLRLQNLLTNCELEGRIFQFFLFLGGWVGG